MGKKRSLTISGRYKEIKHACEFVSEGAAHAGFDEDAIFQVQLACDEACTNVIEHTYQAEGVGDITLSWEVRGDKFIVVIEDKGHPFDPDDIPPAPVPPLPIDASVEDDLKVGGLGVYFMRKLMDKVTYSYREGSGNVLTMIKQLPGKKKQ